MRVLMSSVSDKTRIFHGTNPMMKIGVIFDAKTIDMFITLLDVRMEKEQKQELGRRVSVLPIPAFHHCEPLCVACTQCTVECRNG